MKMSTLNLILLASVPYLAEAESLDYGTPDLNSLRLEAEADLSRQRANPPVILPIAPASQMQYYQPIAPMPAEPTAPQYIIDPATNTYTRIR